MQIEVKTRMKMGKSCPIVVMDVLFVPRGSGNRNAARRLADQFKTNPKLTPHIERVICGVSKVQVHFISSLALLAEVNDMCEAWKQQTERDDPGQLKMFGIA